MGETPYHIPKDTLFPIKYNKKQCTFTIREDVLHQFNEYAEKNSLNKTGVIEKMMIVFLENAGVVKKVEDGKKLA